jgi:hypothetical protein
VNQAQGIANLLNVANCGGFRQWMIGQHHAAQRLSGNIIHDNVGQAAIAEEIANPDYMRVRKSSQPFRFILKLADKIYKSSMLTQRFMNSFDHHNLRQDVMGCFVGNAKPTLPQFLVEGIFAAL